MTETGPFNLCPPRWRILAALASLALALPAQASFHLMQIEQVIGGVNGDTTAQAVQLRMRMANKNFATSPRVISAIVRGVENATGVGLVEAYSLN